jgi:hypothetical protein
VSIYPLGLLGFNGCGFSAVVEDMEKILAARISPYPDPATDQMLCKVSTGPVNNRVFYNIEDLLT